MSFTSIETAQRMAAVEKKRKEGGDVMGTLTMRDYFAAKAMQAILSSDKYVGLIGVNRYEQRTAEDAYKMADAMLKERDAK